MKISRATMSHFFFLLLYFKSFEMNYMKFMTGVFSIVNRFIITYQIILKLLAAFRPIWRMDRKFNVAIARLWYWMKHHFHQKNCKLVFLIMVLFADLHFMEPYLHVMYCWPLSSKHSCTVFIHLWKEYYVIPCAR